MTLDVLVIGAGVSGLACARHLAEADLAFVLLEDSTRIGGLWAFDGTAAGGVMECTRINVSKYNYAFAGHPFPDHTVDFPHHTELLAYIHSYAQRFGLERYIQFGQRLEHLRFSQGLWQATVRDLSTGQAYELAARYVAAATGHHREPRRPEVAGLTTFPGQVLHSAEFKSAHRLNLSDRRALVVGFGNSAVDVACELARCGAHVVLSARSRGWIVPPYILGYAADLYVSRLFLNLPFPLATFIFESILALSGHHPRKLGYRPMLAALRAHPTVSHEIFQRVREGRVEILGAMDRVDAQHVHFEGGEIRDVQAVVFCTGYKTELAWLEEEVRAQVLQADGAMDLYLGTFSPAIGPSLAFVGFVQPFSGGLLPMAEQQARWLVALIRGETVLPQIGQMKAEIASRRRWTSRRLHPSPRHSLQWDPLAFNDALQRQISARRPKLWPPKVAWRILLSSCGVDQWDLGTSGAQRAAALRSVVGVPVPPLIRWAATGLAVSLLVVVAATAVAAIWYVDLTN